VLGEVKVCKAAEGGPEDEAAFWVEPAFPNNEKDSSQIKNEKNQQQADKKRKN